MKTKPEKPYPGFLLFPHGNGQWAKKIRGKLHYFGPWLDPHAALRKYLTDKDDLEAGRRPVVAGVGDTLTVEQLGAKFLAAKTLQVESGELSLQTWDRYEAYAKRLVKVFGSDTPVDTLRPEDFQRYRANLQKTYKSLESLRTAVMKTRAIFNWSKDQGYGTPRFGEALKSPARAALDKARASQGKRVFTPEQIHSLLAHASIKLKAMILLGVNCGYGNSDCACVPMLELKGDWATFARTKTWIQRRCFLWPETVDAIEEVRKCRRGHSSGLLFITKYGHPFRPCAVGFEFEKAAVRAGYSKDEADFYDLRRTCASIGIQVGDDDAVRTILGHKRQASDMLGIYNRLSVSDSRLKAVSEYVRGWLYQKLATVSLEEISA
jgi:integrase